MNEMTEYKVVFDWKSTNMELLGERSKNNLQNNLVEAYNAFCEETNEHLDEWNSKAEELGLLQPEASENEYMDFMYSKYEETLKKMKRYNKVFLKIIHKGGYFAKYDFYIGRELELHLTLAMEGMINDICHDVSFHIEKNEG